ncbi:MAG: Large protein containing transglutaminase-like domain, partial [Actinomycetia bacterium]|nr:Large protein containing transglutaminase-like domain [Actinomycetes bacterium]
FATALTAALGLPEASCHPAYEDPLAVLAAEAAVPAGEPPAGDVAPDEVVGADRRLRALRAVDEQAGEPTGWVLPLHPIEGGWATSQWTMRRGRLVLLPGDSPVGMRLPLAALTWMPAPPEPDRSSFEPAGGLDPAAPTTAEVVEPEAVPPTAVCVEVGDGHVRVFLPPFTDVAAALALVTVVEAVAAEQGQPVVLEGYPPPHHPGLRSLAVTPDPGVIEVNVHPTASWPELVAVTTGLYADARASRLATETFHLDGTHAGTGGGNHLTLGGPTPADSPVLRRPDLLRSLLTHWQRHPSLSYLFTGRFVGPTSQAPRVDEGRDEALHELEIAFAELGRLAAADELRPWHVDRLLRNLLVDLTGNTHRAEFCIDKLFAPGSERGRLGLLELRGFEMPPHARMALVQALLVRALVARAWDEPIEGRLVRWGTQLHDRFLLPWFVAEDIAEVVDDLRAHGIAFERSWLDPFLEFRFPRLGECEVDGVFLELRAAIEPWKVLGEEVTSTATARYVDSAVERVQVLARGITEGRHAVTCNGRVVPLRATSEVGTAVAGVRYKAWAPPSSLHPTIGVHAPLVFDVVDLWNRRSLGGCTYHVVHPGGRTYERFPVNANEAEARRVRRFEAHGHTPGPLDIDITGALEGGDYPRTLDLRLPPAG